VQQAYIKQSVILNYLVCHDKTCRTDGRCHRRSDGQRDTRRGWWGVCGRRRDGQMCMRGVRLPPVPARLSPTTPPPMRRQLMGPVRSWNMDWQAGGRPGMRQHSLFLGVRLHTKTTLLQYYKQFHAVT